MSKFVVLMFIVLLASSSNPLFEVTFAQTVPKPSVPEFIVSVIDSSYDVQTITTTTTDLDGRTITKTRPGYHMVNGSKCYQ